MRMGNLAFEGRGGPGRPLGILGWKFGCLFCGDWIGIALVWPGSRRPGRC